MRCYEKLKNIYDEAHCSDDFSLEILYPLSEYVDGIYQDPYRKYLNPYEFSRWANITVPKSIKLFLYFSNPDINHAFIVRPFIECHNQSCDHKKIFFDPNDPYFICDECETEYSIESALRVAKVYFELIKDFPGYDESYTSTYNVLCGVPSHLKVLSPSSESIDEGDNSVCFDDIIKNNVNSAGNKIVAKIPSFHQRLMNNLKHRRRGVGN